MRLLPVVAVVITLALMAAAAWQILETPGSVSFRRGGAPTPAATPAQPLLIPITKGDSSQEIAERLESEGVIDSALHFRVLVSLLGYDGLLQAGEYEFDPATPVLEAVLRIRQRITSGLVVTIVEGWRREQIADRLEREGVVPAEEFLAAAVAPYDFDFLSELSRGAPLEGYLFPATYMLRRTMTAEEIVQEMLSTFDENFTSELRQEAAAAGLPLHTVVSLASIVEREAPVPEERPVIAQVFLKRLRLGWPLEADPTVQYALANDPANVKQFGYWKKELTQQDLEVDSPYNTYRNPGLPPGPIASPGLDSITAVIRPADTNYLYFVAKPDGSHAFAETLDEHLENVEKYGRR